MALHTLTYLGTGAEHDVGSVPFSSELVWVGTGDITGTDELTVWSHPAIQPDQSFYFANGTLYADILVAINSDGFRVGAVVGVWPPDWDDSMTVNISGVTYHAICLAGSEIAVGTYVGDGTADLPISGLGFAPELVIAGRHGNFVPLQRHTNMPAGDSYVARGTPFSGIPAYNPLTNGIKSLDADGFTVGNHASVNGNGAPHSYIAFNTIAGAVAFGTYSGNGAQDREISVGFRAGFVWLFGLRASNVTEMVCWRSNTMAGNRSLGFVNGADVGGAWVTHGVRGLTEDGFIVGDATPGERMNISGDTYYWMAIIGAAGPYGGWF